MKRLLPCAEGFTLIETMIAMFLVSFIVGQLGLVQISTTRSAQLSKQIGQANALADDALEKSRNIDSYGNLQTALPGLNEACVIHANVATCTSSAPIGGIFTRVRMITPLNAANTVTSLASSSKADVVVTVTFTDARLVAQRVSVASVMTRY